MDSGGTKMLSDLQAKRRGLVAEREDSKRALRALLNEMREGEERLRLVDQRLQALDEFLRLEFPGAEPSPAEPRESWAQVPLTEAVGKALAEADHYLTDSQIKHALRSHGMSVEDTAVLAGRINAAIEDGAPLLKVSEEHYGRQEWADEARESLPKRSPA